MTTWQPTSSLEGDIEISFANGGRDAGDSDGDGWPDEEESLCGSDQSDANSTPDWICDNLDEDVDNDGFPDPACVNTGIGTPSKLEGKECAEGDEDRFPRDP